MGVTKKSQLTDWSPSFFIHDCTGRIAVIAEDSVRFAHSGPSQRILRGLTTTCLRRAPPPAHVRGWTGLRNHCYPPSWYKGIKI